MLSLRGLIFDQEGLGREEVARLAALTQPVVAHYQTASRQAAEELDCTSHLRTTDTTDTTDTGRE